MAVLIALRCVHSQLRKQVDLERRVALQMVMQAVQG